MAGWPVESSVFLAIHPVLFCHGNFCFRGAVSEDVPPGARWAWCIEGGLAEGDSQEIPGWPFLRWTGTKLAPDLWAPDL